MKTTKTKTKLQIINETVEFYSKNPRAVEAGGCRILTSDGRTCAYGRCMTEEAQKQFLNKVGPTPSNSHNDENMQLEYRGHNGDFWNDIQVLHDNESYWNGAELTPDGEEYVRQLKQRYSDSNL
jgi:hypothetical protein